jgi:hypothetical protein
MAVPITQEPLVDIAGGFQFLESGVQSGLPLRKMRFSR